MKKEALKIVAVVGIVAFVTFPTWTGAPTRERVLSVVSDLRPSAAVIFGGDIMLDRTVRAAIDARGGDFVFSCVRDVLRDADLVVANLEGPITGYPSVSLGSTIGSPENFTFTFPQETSDILQRANIRMVSLGNNHILNFGLDGVRQTTKELSAADVRYFGDPTNQNTARERVRGVALAFINYNEFAPNGWRTSASTTLEQIAAARRDGYIPVVYAHWGDEYESAPLRAKELARAFVDAGAEIVIGSHPHIVQEHEVYKEKYIYYSLGNFVFDQYWSESVRRGLLLKAVFSAKGVERLEEIPIDNQNGPRPCAV